MCIFGLEMKNDNWQQNHQCITCILYRYRGVVCKYNALYFNSVLPNNVISSSDKSELESYIDFMTLPSMSLRHFLTRATGQYQWLLG